MSQLLEIQMSKSQSKIFKTIGSKKYFWCMDHKDQVNSIIGFVGILIGPVAIIAIVELMF